MLSDSYTLIPEDQPAAVAEAIRTFMTTTSSHHAARGTGDAGGDRTTGDDSQQERMLEMNVVKSELGTSW